MHGYIHGIRTQVQTLIHTDKQSGTHMHYKKTDRQTDRQTDRERDTHTHTCIQLITNTHKHKNHTE